MRTLPAFQRHSATSREAAVATFPHRVTAAERVFAVIAEHGPCTDEQISVLANMNPSSARPRRVDLVAAGLVREAGFALTRSGRRAVTWETVPVGCSQQALPL